MTDEGDMDRWFLAVALSNYVRFRAGSVVSSKELRTWPVWIDFHANLPLTSTELSLPFASTPPQVSQSPHSTASDPFHAVSDHQKTTGVNERKQLAWTNTDSPWNRGKDAHYIAAERAREWIDRPSLPSPTKRAHYAAVTRSPAWISTQVLSPDTIRDSFLPHAWRFHPPRPHRQDG